MAAVIERDRARAIPQGLAGEQSASESSLVPHSPHVIPSGEGVQDPFFSLYGDALLSMFIIYAGAGIGLVDSVGIIAGLNPELTNLINQSDKPLALTSEREQDAIRQSVDRTRDIFVLTRLSRRLTQQATKAEYEFKKTRTFSAKPWGELADEYPMYADQIDLFAHTLYRAKDIRKDYPVENFFPEVLEGEKLSLIDYLLLDIFYVRLNQQIGPLRMAAAIPSQGDLQIAERLFAELRVQMGQVIRQYDEVVREVKPKRLSTLLTPAGLVNGIFEKITDLSPRRINDAKFRPADLVTWAVMLGYLIPSQPDQRVAEQVQVAESEELARVA